jgi:SpoVK/Ycf46/Vps4 family AAA+-type ATPase
MPCSPEQASLNAQKSTGPCTARGKAIASRNAKKHGLTSAKAPLLASEDVSRFRQLFQSLLDRYAPDNLIDHHLVEKVAMAIHRQRRLWSAEAERRKLKPPKAVLLWGIPGTGKSLAAKLAARRIGGTLVASDWNGLMGKSVRESLSNLDYLLDFLKRIGTSVLLFDEFEKAFMGWDESGHLGKLAARLLSWMNDHEEPCVMFATINHLQLLPPEMIRRFEIVHFFGMPHNGALQQMFAVHLDKYFDYDFSLDEWHYLLREYRGCTPAEVMKAVKRTANRRFFRDMQDGEAIDDHQPTLTLAELIEERETFVPDASKRDVSDMLAGILNRADYAEPVQGEDTSIYAEPPHQLLGIDEAQIRHCVSELQQTPSAPEPLLTRPRPAIEDI